MAQHEKRIVTVIGATGVQGGSVRLFYRFRFNEYSKLINVPRSFELCPVTQISSSVLSPATPQAPRRRK